MSDPVTEAVEPQQPGFSVGRLEAFSDGVIAIAITLLVLDLRVPEPGRALGAALTDEAHLSSYAAYVVSFLILGITWVNHHSLFRRIAVIDRALLFLNLLLLLGLSVVFYPTAVLARFLTAGNADAHVAAFFYSAVMLWVSLMFAAIWWHATAHGGRLLHVRLTPDQARASRLRFGIGSFGYLATLGLAFLSAPLTLAVHALFAGYYAFEQLRT